MAEEAETAAGRVWEVFDTEPLIADHPTGRRSRTPTVRSGSTLCTSRIRGARRWSSAGSTSRSSPAKRSALVGATGSGKTTLATLLPQLEDVTAGRVMLDGHDVHDLTLSSLHAHVGFAFEEPTLFSASVRENLLIGYPDTTEADIENTLEVAQAAFAYDLPWGLDTRIGEQGLSLSGGQRQRLALAHRDRRPATSARARRSALRARRAHRRPRVEAEPSAPSSRIAPRSSWCTGRRRITLADRATLIDGGRISRDRIAPRPPEARPRTRRSSARPPTTTSAHPMTGRTISRVFSQVIRFA